MALALVFGAAPALADERAALPALNSYAQPPFARPEGGGLAATFVTLLNEEVTPGGARATLETIPRRRLEAVLGDPAFQGMALFLTPEFLPRSFSKPLQWSAPVMVDENLIVSVRPLALTSLDELSGLRFGAVAGHVYRLVGPLVDAGRVKRDDALDHVANLRKLCLGRVDFVVISRSELAGTVPLVQCPVPLRPMAFPEPQVIVRRVAVRMADAADAQSVLEALARVACSDRWLGALAKLGLSSAGCSWRGR
jgi:polar amino acid transport system substrate-binding protein